MIMHVWTVLCSRSSIDRETNNVSLFDVLEQITIEDWAGHPGLVPGQFELVSLWSRYELDRPSRGEARLTLRTPGGGTHAEQMQPIDLREYRRLRNRTRLPAIPIDVPGSYRFVIECRQMDQEEWVQVAIVPLEVQVAAAAQGPQEGGEPAPQ